MALPLALMRTKVALRKLSSSALSISCQTSTSMRISLLAWTSLTGLPVTGPVLALESSKLTQQKWKHVRQDRKVPLCFRMHTHTIRRTKMQAKLVVSQLCS
jgi:hypothetical protein